MIWYMPTLNLYMQLGNISDILLITKYINKFISQESVACKSCLRLNLIAY